MRMIFFVLSLLTIVVVNDWYATFELKLKVMAYCLI